MSYSAWAPALCAVIAVWLTARHCRPDPRDWPGPENKLILVWVPFFSDPFYSFGGGKKSDFDNAGCDVSDCEIVADHRRLTPDRYDAVLFHGFEYYVALYGTPKERSPHQLYVYINLESEIHAEIPWYQSDFFNLTMTYRLDSDIPWTYFSIIDKWSDDVIAPSTNPFWDEVHGLEEASNSEDEIKELVRSKTGAVAWVASNCNSDSGREEYVNSLQKYINVDVYGRCGPLSCPRNEREDCTTTLGRKYYFYLSFENSICVDYVTEKIVTALRSGAVPVVLSGANLTRFLPPGSYLDARKLGPKALATRMLQLISNHSLYERFLWWKTRYKVQGRQGFDIRWQKGQHPFCSLCAVLHRTKSFKTRRKKVDVRDWWHTLPDSSGGACQVVSSNNC